MHKYVVDWHIIYNLRQEVKITVRKRSLYYWSKSYGETISEAETYESLKKTIVINILGYTEIKESGKIHTRFKIMEQEEHFNLLEDLEIHYLELPKLPRKKIEDLDDVELWLDFLKESPRKGNSARLRELTGRSEIMGEAVNKLMEISADEKMRELAMSREKARLDMISRLKYAENKGRREGRQEGRREGRQEGLQEGMKKGRQELAKTMLLDGEPLDKIAKYTRLSTEKIENIRKELKH